MTLAEALRREKELKTGKGRDEVQRILKKLEIPVEAPKRKCASP